MEVQGMKVGKARVLLGMRTEDLKGWLRESIRNKDPVRRRWELVVRLVNIKFGDGTLPAELSWATMVIIPKGKG